MAVNKAVDSTVLDGYFSDIADAIRAKSGASDTYTPAQMPQAIADMPAGNPALMALLEGTASGVITLSGIESLFGAEIMIGAPSGSEEVNPISELHCPDLIKWGGPGTSYKFGGLIDGTEATGSTAAPLQLLDLPKCTTLYIDNARHTNNGKTFTKLTSINAPLLVELYGSLPQAGITVIDFPALTTISGGIFKRCSDLTEIRLPKLTSGFGNYTCQNCTALELADIGEVSVNGCFMGTCTALKALVLRKKNYIATLSSSNELTGTPIAAGTGYIYVPRNLIASYQVATNWSNYAAQFRALEDYTDDGTITGRFIMPT